MLLTSILLPLVLRQTAALEIKDTKVGTGLKVQVGDLVTVDYVGTLVDGKEFDSSKKPGRKPFVFQVGVGQVIKGWEQGLIGMQPGGVRNLTIPPQLGYGSQEAGEIPANSTLKFEVTLVKIADRVQIKTLKDGTGVGAKVGDIVSFHYKGTLKDGTEFDNSYKRNAPLKLPLGQRVIAGFTQGLLGIKLGEKRQIIIPSELGYGTMPIPQQDTTDPSSGKVVKAGSIFPANSELIFEIELVEVKEPTKE